LLFVDEAFVPALAFELYDKSFEYLLVEI